MVVKWMDAALQRRRREQHLVAIKRGLKTAADGGAGGGITSEWAPSYVCGWDRLGSQSLDLLTSFESASDSSRNPTWQGSGRASLTDANQPSCSKQHTRPLLLKPFLDWAARYFLSCLLCTCHILRISLCTPEVRCLGQSIACLHDCSHDCLQRNNLLFEHQIALSCQIACRSNIYQSGLRSLLHLFLTPWLHWPPLLQA